MLKLKFMIEFIKCLLDKSVECDIIDIESEVDT